MRGIHRWSVNSPLKGPVTRKMFPPDDVMMKWNHPHAWNNGPQSVTLLRRGDKYMKIQHECFHTHDKKCYGFKHQSAILLIPHCSCDHSYEDSVCTFLIQQIVSFMMNKPQKGLLPLPLHRRPVMHISDRFHAMYSSRQHTLTLNSLALGRCGSNSNSVIFIM